MNYVLAPNGVVSQYPYTYSMLLADNPDISFPRVPGTWLQTYNVFEVVPTAKPAYDLTKNIVEANPVFANGQWNQVWVQVAASAQEIADRQTAAADALAKEQALADRFVGQFINMTQAEVSTYVTNNTANLAQTRGVLDKIARMVHILAKREFRS